VKKLRVGVIYGGRSGEHEVSLASAAAVFQNLDPERYEAVPIRINKDGRWVLPSTAPRLTSAAEVIAAKSTAPASALGAAGDREAQLVPRPGEQGDQSAGAGGLVAGVGLDVVFPAIHGPYGEDGTVQGLLELANVPYVGCGVLASAMGMDKAAMKVAFAANGLPICDYEVVLKHEWRKNEHLVLRRIGHLGFPVFVKPANLGSSVGISKARHAVELRAAIGLAAEFDRKIIVEAAVPQAREIECSVLGNDDPQASVAGEIVPSREFYDYESKYIDDGSVPLIPAPITEAQADEVRALSIAAFKAIDGAGMARVDFLLARDTGVLYLNEVNTIPGFTTIGMFAKLWGASGVAFPQLVDRLIELAIERHRDKQQLRTSM
jgi:D-alanine-D-alanine ligase